MKNEFLRRREILEDEKEERKFFLTV